MGSPLPQASQNRDAAWQGAKATALPEGRYPNLPGWLKWREKKPARKRLRWEKVERGDAGREGWFGEGEVLGGPAGEERLVEVWGEKVTVECGDSEQPRWSDGMELGVNRWRKGNGAGRFAAFCSNEQRRERLRGQMGRFS